MFFGLKPNPYWRDADHLLRVNPCIFNPHSVAEMHHIGSNFDKIVTWFVTTLEADSKQNCSHLIPVRVAEFFDTIVRDLCTFDSLNAFFSKPIRGSFGSLPI